MRARLFCLFTALAVVWPLSSGALAHHSFAAEFLMTEAMWTGPVSKIEWRSPHVHIYLDIKDASGKVTTWMYEFPSPEQIVRRGLNRAFIKIGDVLTVEGYPAKANQPKAMIHRVAANGEMIFVSNFEDFGPTKSEGPVVTPTGERIGEEPSSGWNSGR